MKEQEKQIKEMAKEIGNTWLVDLECNTKDVCEVLDEVDINNIARELYDKNYRKLPEDSVVLSRKEYDKLKYTWITDSDAYKKGCKETAEKFVNETIKRKQTLMNPYTDDESECVSTFWIYELAKQFGVEIKE